MLLTEAEYESLLEDGVGLLAMVDEAGRLAREKAVLVDDLRKAKNELERARHKLRRHEMVEKLRASTAEDRRRKGEGSNLPDPGGLT